MAQPAKEKWWDDVIRVDAVRLNDHVHLLWGDRVRILRRDHNTGNVRVFARGSVGWIPGSALGGEPLLELYFIDVGQGDGILIVTPEGHHLMIDGGHRRSLQQTGKSAADFIDWKFHKEYLFFNERDDPVKNIVRLDAMIASHADADHYGGLRDLIDREVEAQENELDSEGCTVEAFYHPGLCPQVGGTEGLGPKSNGFFTKLLDDRTSAEEGLTHNPPQAPKLRGWWRDFISAVVETKTAAGNPTPMTRLSHLHDFLPGFSDLDDTEVKIRVLAPIESNVGGAPALKDLGDEGENKNGHSVALRLDYKDRRFLLTGDLNDKSHRDILAAYGPNFEDAWRVDVAKACHHGSHHVDFRFLKGLAALATIFSSGDANTYDHPRAWVLGAAAIAGRIIEDHGGGRLKAPLVYSTEVARSIALGEIDQLRAYHEPQSYGLEEDEPIQTVTGEVTKSKWRVVLDRDSIEAKDFRPLSDTKVMRNIIYGLVNVRTDGRRLLFAVRNEGNQTWAYETLEASDIAAATIILP